MLEQFALQYITQITGTNLNEACAEGCTMDACLIMTWPGLGLWSLGSCFIGRQAKIIAHVSAKHGRDLP